MRRGASLRRPLRLASGPEVLLSCDPEELHICVAHLSDAYSGRSGPKTIAVSTVMTGQLGPSVTGKEIPGNFLENCSNCAEQTGATYLRSGMRSKCGPGRGRPEAWEENGRDDPCERRVRGRSRDATLFAWCGGRMSVCLCTIRGESVLFARNMRQQTRIWRGHSLQLAGRDLGALRCQLEMRVR